MFCPNCGEKILDESKFCVFCGNNLQKNTLKYITRDVSCQSGSVSNQIENVNELVKPKKKKNSKKLLCLSSKTIIGDDITQYVRVNETMLFYISGGDLYLYNGKKKSLIQNNVDWIWCQNTMESPLWYY